MKIGDDGWFLVPGVQHHDGREGAVLVVPAHNSYAATFMDKQEILRMYHALGDELMRQRHMEEQPLTTDNHIE